VGGRGGAGGRGGVAGEAGEAAPLGCPVCGQRLLRPGACPNWWCGRSDRWFSVVYPVGVHQGALRQALGRYKYRGERWWAGAFARIIAAYLDRNANWFEEFDVLAGVPAYCGPGTARAWDPVGDILDRVDQLTAPAWEVDRHAVVKRWETPPMRGRSRVERQRLAIGPLRESLHVPHPERLAGVRVLVLDDVLTEGSTLREVARALRLAGAEEVAGLVLARPVWTGQRRNSRPSG
jgi:predicted amidophosphoribosyltransferase